MLISHTGLYTKDAFDVNVDLYSAQSRSASNTLNARNIVGWNRVRRNLISLQPRSTRSSSVVTLSRPPTISSLKITDRSFSYAPPRLWNQLPDSFRQPHHCRLDSFPHPLLNSSLSSSTLSSSITLSLQAQNLFFQQIHSTVDFFYLYLTASR